MQPSNYCNSIVSPNRYHCCHIQAQSRPSLPEKNTHPYRCTPLHYAAGAGDVDLCKRLIEKGAKVSTWDFYQYSAVDYAKQSGANDCVAYLEEVSAVATTSNAGKPSSTIDYDSNFFRRFVLAFIVRSSLFIFHVNLSEVFIYSKPAYGEVSCGSHVHELICFEFTAAWVRGGGGLRIGFPGRKVTKFRIDNLRVGALTTNETRYLNIFLSELNQQPTQKTKLPRLSSIFREFL